ncbi:MAG: cbb3-type cytochrome oxidase assembly protein CcoS [Planctomycetota bacterium]
MSILFIAVPVAIAVAASAVCALVWVVRSGQLDDLETPPHRVLLDDDGDVAADSVERQTAGD